MVYTKLLQKYNPWTNAFNYLDVSNLLLYIINIILINIIYIAISITFITKKIMIHL